MSEDTEDTPIIIGSGLAELIGVPSNIDIRTLNRNFPFASKQMTFANLSSNKIMDIMDDYHAGNIIKRSKMTRGEKSRILDRGDFVSMRALLTAELSLSEGGFLTRRITGVYKHLETSEAIQGGNTKKGMFGGLFKGGNNE